MISAIPLRAQVHSYSRMVAFGDSLSDGGNLNYLLSSISEKTAQYLTGWDPNYYFNYRFSNGPVWVDHLYTRLDFPNFGTMRPNDGGGNIDGTNFAWAGSRSGDGAYGGVFPNLKPQIGFYLEQLAAGNLALKDPETTLFTIWSGANDVFAHVETHGTAEPDPITPEQVAANIATAISSLYAVGGRSFVIPNLPPIGKIPSYINHTSKGPLATAFVNRSNEQLAIELDALSGSLEGISIFEVDIHGLFLDITANYEAYGFTNVTNTAYIRFGEQPYQPRDPPYGEIVPNAATYFYWDAAHGTTLTNSYIADAAYYAIIPEPSTWLLLVFAGLCLSFFARKPHNRTLSIKPNP